MSRFPAAGARPIGFWIAVALVVGNMIGSGVFLLPASLAPYGGLGLGGWFVSTAGAVLLALVFARLAGFDPAAGGPYAYTRRAFGNLPAFVVAWGYWVSIWSANAALAIAFTGYVTPFVPGLADSPAAAGATAVGVVWLFTAVNLLGIRAAGRVQVVATLLKILPLLVIGAAGLVWFEPAHFAVADASPGTVASTLSATAILTLWAFLGLESATIPSESIANADRTIPRATVAGTLVAAGIYIFATVGVMSLVAPDALGRSAAPFADAARLVGGGGLAAAVALGAAVSCLGALNGWVLLVGQLPLAVARDGLFPPIFGRVTSNGTPAAGMLIGGVLATALVAMNFTRGLVALFTFVILLSTLSMLIPYALSSLAGFFIRRDGRRLFAGRGPATIALLACLYSLWAIAGAGLEAILWGAALLAAGLPVYVWLRRAARPGAAPGPAGS